MREREREERSNSQVERLRLNNGVEAVVGGAAGSVDFPTRVLERRRRFGNAKCTKGKIQYESTSELRSLCPGYERAEGRTDYKATV
jgi:hypothetical protein